MAELRILVGRSELPRRKKAWRMMSMWWRAKKIRSLVE
jgi:hypothetical protein